MKTEKVSLCLITWSEKDLKIYSVLLFPYYRQYLHHFQSVEIRKIDVENKMHYSFISYIAATESVIYLFIYFLALS